MTKTTKTPKTTKMNVISETFVDTEKNMPLEQMPIIPLNLNQKLVKIGQSVEYLQKKVEGVHKNKYIDSAELLKAIRVKMNEYNVLLIIDIVDPKTDKDGNGFTFQSVINYTWINSDTKESLEIKWFATGIHRSDPSMAFGSALTYSERYFFLKFFQIPTGNDDPELFIQKNMTNEDKEQKEQSIKGNLIEIVARINNDSDLRAFYAENKRKYDPKIFNDIMVKRSEEINKKDEEIFDGKQ